MTDDPRRWLDDPDALDDTEFSVLSAGRDAAPPGRLRGAIWGALAARLPIAEAAAATGAGISVAGVGAASLAKALAAGVAAGALVMGGVTLATAPPAPAATGVASGVPANRTTPRSPNIVASKTGEIPVEERSLERTEARGPAASGTPFKKRVPRSAEPVRAGDGPSSPSAFATPPGAATDGAALEGSSPSSAANEESELIANARRSLRAGNVEDASRALARARSLFPSGVLVQEREALAVEALIAGGQRELARRQATAFLRAYPNSPYGARVRALSGIGTP